MGQNGIETVLRYLPISVQSALRQLSAAELRQIQEIRLRAEHPVCVMRYGQERVLQPALILSQKAVEQTFQAVCEYSVYRYTKELREGFVTIPGGNRVGIAGSAVYQDGEFVQIRHISGLNFRISHAVIGCAQQLYQQTCVGEPVSLLLVGTVGAGKTTMLRDLCRLLGESYRVTIVDERGEIAAVQHGTAQYDVGVHTDVLDGFPRAEGLMTALRVLTPEVLVCDEIGTEEDAMAISRIHGCGVPVIASAHGTSWETVQQRPVLRNLLESQVFQYIAVLSRHSLGRVQLLRQGIAV